VIRSEQWIVRLHNLLIRYSFWPLFAAFSCPFSPPHSLFPIINTFDTPENRILDVETHKHGGCTCHRDNLTGGTGVSEKKCFHLLPEKI
jgi:hypothetical protein